MAKNYNRKLDELKEVLTAVDIITSEAKKPAEYRKVVTIVDSSPPTTYSRIDRAVREGYLSETKSEGGFKAVTLTLRGYRALGQEPLEAPKISEESEVLFGYEQAYALLSNVFLTSGAMLDNEQRKVLLKSIDNLITE